MRSLNVYIFFRKIIKVSIIEIGVTGPPTNHKKNPLKLAETKLGETLLKTYENFLLECKSKVKRGHMTYVKLHLVLTTVPSFSPSVEYPSRRLTLERNDEHAIKV